MGQLTILDGATFFYSEDNGDVDAQHHEGFFLEDVRHLSLWQLLLDGKPLELLTGKAVDYYSARIVGTVAGRPISVTRDRFVTDGFHEDVALQNNSDEEQRLRLEVRFGSDFADVLDAQQQGRDTAGVVHVEGRSRSATLWEARDGYRRETVITFRKPGRLRRDRMTYDLRLPPRATWKTCIDVTPVVDGQRRSPLLACDSFGKAEPKMQLSLEEWLEQAPDLVSSDDALEHVYRQSLLDLAALRLRPNEKLEWALPAGGLPWFMTIFGRDSIVASYEALPFKPHLAETTLEALAGLQAHDFDHFADAEPGKIMHELRRGTLAATGVIPRVY